MKRRAIRPSVPERFEPELLQARLEIGTASFEPFRSNTAAFTRGISYTHQPVYYAIVEDRVVFGWELKCILTGGLVRGELDPEAIARSAANLAEADAALKWATDVEWERAVQEGPKGVIYQPSGAPLDIMRRVVRRAVLRLSTEGGGAELRGRELDRLVAALIDGRKATLRGVVCVGGKEWRFAKAPPRKG